MYYGAISFRFRKDTESDIQEALEEAVAAHNVKPAVYARIAAIEKLIRDGFLLGILDDEPKENNSAIRLLNRRIYCTKKCYKRKFQSLAQCRALWYTQIRNKE